MNSIKVIRFSKKRQECSVKLERISDEQIQKWTQCKDSSVVIQKLPEKLAKLAKKQTLGPIKRKEKEISESFVNKNNGENFNESSMFIDFESEVTKELFKRQITSLDKADFEDITNQKLETKLKNDTDSLAKLNSIETNFEQGQKNVRNESLQNPKQKCNEILDEKLETKIENDTESLTKFEIQKDNEFYLENSSETNFDQDQKNVINESKKSLNSIEKSKIGPAFKRKHSDLQKINKKPPESKLSKYSFDIGEGKNQTKMPKPEKPIIKPKKISNEIEDNKENVNPHIEDQIGTNLQVSINENRKKFLMSFEKLDNNLESEYR